MISEFNPMQRLSPLQNFICTIGNLPTSYALSLSYEEQIMWLCKFLEEKVLPALETNTEITEETQQAFLELQQYVTDYFNNLDVQEEINNKLDEMYSSGQLTALLQPLLTPLENQISSLASGSPIPVSSTSQMTNTSKVYVNTTDGNWYYYNGTSWVSGGVYQATQIQDNSLDFFQKLKNVGFLNNGLINIEKTWENGGLNPNTRRRNK